MIRLEPGRTVRGFGDFIEISAARIAQAVNPDDGWAIIADHKSHAAFAAGHVEKAEIIRHAREVLGLDRLPARHALLAEVTVPELQQPPLIDGLDHVRPRFWKQHRKDAPISPAVESI